MKKLITAAVASAFAFLAIGAVNAVDLPSGTSVESYTGALQTTKNDSGSGDDSTYWYLQGDENAELLVTNYVVTPYQPRPEQFTGDNNNYLKIDTTGRLYRSIGVNDQTTTFGNTVDIGDGIYLDTLVQFTAADDQFKADAITAGDKIAISYVEHESEGENDPSYTNFVVRAAYVDAANSTIVATNYFLTFPDHPANEVQFNKDAWHRLTVRAISNVGNTYAPVGFVVYVDGTNLVYDASVVAGDETYVGSLNSVVKTYLYNSETHALLPSLLRYGETGYDTLSAVAFNGNGCVDDISFTATKPGILPSEGTAVTIAWDANVATYTVVAGETTLIDGEVVSGVGSTNLLLAAEVTAITVTATYAEGYEAGTWTATAGTLNNGAWTDLEGGATLTIKSMEPLFDVGGVHYGSFEDALAAATAGGAYATIKLLADYTGDIAFDTENPASIIIDLAGKTLTGDSDAAIHTGCADIIITNSTVEIGHVVAPDFDSDKSGVAVVCDGAATLTVTAGIFDGAIVPDAQGVVIVVTGGKFYDNEYAEDPTGEFYLAGSVDTTTYTISDADEDYYFTVSSSVEPPAPTTYELRIPAVTGASATVTDKATSSVIADLTAIEDGTVVTVTWTPESGYKITAGDTEEITMDDNQTATAPTVVAITYATLTITPVANCTIIVSNATAEVATGATFDVDDAVELTVYRTPAEGYELDNCAATETITMDQDQTVTAAVKQSGGSYPTYIDPTDAEETAKYTNWATYAEVSDVATGEVNEEAYLLNCKPSEVAAAKAAFKFTSISYDSTQSKWVTPTTTSYNNRDYNGEVVVKQYSDVGCTTESSTGTFFKAVLQ